MPTLLKDIVITKVALCAEGACSEAHVMLYKNKNNEGGCEEMTFEEILEKMKPEHRAVVEAEMQKAKDEVPTETATELEKAKEDVQAKTTELETLQTEMAKSKQADDEEELLKSVDPAIRAIIEKTRNEKAAADAVLAKMADDQSTALAKSRAGEVAHIGTDAEEMTTMLKSLYGKDSELADKVFEVLKHADAVIAKSGTFEELGGSGGQAEVGAWAQIEAQASELAKSKNIAVSKAISEVITNDPKLYQAYLDEQVKTN